MTRMLMSGLPRRVLVLIVDEGTIEARDGRMSSVIAGMLQVRQYRVTRTLHRLDALGLIERRHVPLTGRTFSVRATPEGRAAVNREGHVGAVVRRAARVEVSAPMPCPGPIGHLSFDAERVRACQAEAS